MPGWIYAFADSGYEMGVKIGRDGAASGLGRYKVAWCYSPRPIEYLATWQIPDSVPLVEAERMARTALPPMATRHGGEEWVALTRPEAIEAVSDNLGARPSQQAITLQRAPEHDDFRNPKRISAATRFKQVLWVYREEVTDRVKTQRIDEWQTPRETRRTYSRNGFIPVAAFTYSGTPGLMQNAKVHGVWEDAIQRFGNGSPCRHGWLPEGTSVCAVKEFYREAGLMPLRDFDRKPEGVRARYNRPEP